MGNFIKRQKAPSEECKSTFFLLMTKWDKDTLNIGSRHRITVRKRRNRILVLVPLALLGISEGNIRWRRRRRKEELKKEEGRKKMDSDSNTGSTGSTQIQYKHIGEIQNGNTVEIQGEAGQFGKKPVELLPASGNNETAAQTTRS